ncbi:MAG: GGDEF domain-containing protein [Cyanobacteria bacterium J06635_15]
MRSCLTAEPSHIARFGGDEFVVVIEAVSSLAALSRLVQRILDSFKAPVMWQEKPLPINVSIGAALNNPEQIGVDQLLQNADTAMYQAKRGGKGCYRLFQAETQMMSLI